MRAMHDPVHIGPDGVVDVRPAHQVTVEMDPRVRYGRVVHALRVRPSGVRASTEPTRSHDDEAPVSGNDDPIIQVFGLENDQATRAAVRFFKERRTPISMVDLRKRSIAPGELRRFTERLGARALLDETSRAYRDAGLGYMRLDDASIVERLLADDRLLRLPLVRRGTDVTVGRAEATWTTWLRPATGP